MSTLLRKETPPSKYRALSRALWLYMYSTGAPPENMQRSYSTESGSSPFQAPIFM